MLSVCLTLLMGMCFSRGSNCTTNFSRAALNACTWKWTFEIIKALGVSLFIYQAVFLPDLALGTISLRWEDKAFSFYSFIHSLRMGPWDHMLGNEMNKKNPFFLLCLNQWGNNSIPSQGIYFIIFLHPAHTRTRCLRLVRADSAGSLFHVASSKNYLQIFVVPCTQPLGITLDSMASYLPACVGQRAAHASHVPAQRIAELRQLHVAAPHHA